jgi:hypothetical protein
MIYTVYLWYKEKSTASFEDDKNEGEEADAHKKE